MTTPMDDDAILSRIRATTPQVDPDLLAVRLIVADRRKTLSASVRVLSGKHDDELQDALAAYKAGKAGKAVGR